jgi:hypothetical protein
MALVAPKYCLNGLLVIVMVVVVLVLVVVVVVAVVVVVVVVDVVVAVVVVVVVVIVVAVVVVVVVPAAHPAACAAAPDRIFLVVCDYEWVCIKILLDRRIEKVLYDKQVNRSSRSPVIQHTINQSYLSN